MSRLGTTSASRDTLLEAKIAATKSINGKVMDAEFPIHLKQDTEVLAQRVDRHRYMVMAPYGDATAECILHRNDLVFARA